MPEFVRDFRSLNEFTQGYIEAAFWTGTDGIEARSFSDLAPETLAVMLADSMTFQLANAEDLEAGDCRRHGIDFWLTRNRHGAGFWDRGYGERGDRLTKSAHTYGECHLYVGDDNLIYI
jgi:hypothetical protein